MAPPTRFADSRPALDGSASGRLLSDVLSLMNGHLLPRLQASVLLALLFAGPFGPLGAIHVAQTDAAVSHDLAVSATGEGSPAGHGPACAVCHLLTGLRFTTPAWPTVQAPAHLSALLPIPPRVSVTLVWLADVSAGRAPPRS